MNRYPLWKYLLVLCVLAIGVLYSAPNLFPPDPAIQISGESGGQSLSDELRSKAVAALENAGIAVKGSDTADTSILLRLADKNQQ
ncbi:MAG TPA: protein translocase subunit SecD, partial [Pseudomonadales bacterium]